MTRVTELVLGIFGAIAACFGLVLLFAGEDQYVGFVGFGSGYTWRVSDVAAAWAYGLLTAGVVLLVVVLAMVVRDHRHPRAH